MLAASRIPLDTIHPEICAFTIGFSCTVWTKMRTLVCSLVDDVLAHFNFSPLTVTTHQYKAGNGSSRKYGN